MRGTLVGTSNQRLGRGPRAAQKSARKSPRSHKEPTSQSNGKASSKRDAARLARREMFWTNADEGLVVLALCAPDEFVIDDFNPLAGALLGLKEKDRGRRLRDCLPSATARLLGARALDCIATRKPVSFESRELAAPAADAIDVTLFVEPRSRSKTRRVFARFKDASSDFRLREALQASRARYEILAESVPELVFALDSAGEWDYANSRFYDYLGKKPGSALDWQMLEDAALAQKLRRQIQARKPRVLEAEAVIIGAGGRRRWFILRARRYEFNGAARWLGVASDIEDIKRASSQIEALNTHIDAFLNETSDSYILVDAKGRVERLNKNARRWLGPFYDAALKTGIFEIDVVDVRVREALREAVSTGRAVHLEFRSYMRPDRWVEVHAYPVDKGMNIFFRDVTERVQALAAMHAASAAVQATLDSIPVHVLLIDSAGRITTANKAWREFADAQVGNAGVGEKYWSVCRALGLAPREGQVSRRGLSSVRKGDQASHRFVIYCTGANHIRRFQVRATRREHQDSGIVVVTHEEITEVAQMQAALQSANARLIDIQDEERRTIASELHDSTSQHLVAIGLGLSRLGRESPSDAGKAILAELRQSLAEAQREIRSFSYLLHAPDISAKGLVPSVRSFVDGYAARTGLQVSFEATNVAHKLPMAAQHALFRVIQEALANVHRHAAARNVQVVLQYEDDHFVVEVKDDGKGLSPRARAGADVGVGIPGMRARVAQMGGVLEVESDDTGTLVRARVAAREAARLASRHDNVISDGVPH